jgi:hypothetical protein
VRRSQGRTSHTRRSCVTRSHEAGQPLIPSKWPHALWAPIRASLSRNRRTRRTSCRLERRRESPFRRAQLTVCGRWRTESRLRPMLCWPKRRSHSSLGSSRNGAALRESSVVDDINTPSLTTGQPSQPSRRIRTPGYRAGGEASPVKALRSVDDRIGHRSLRISSLGAKGPGSGSIFL